MYRDLGMAVPIAVEEISKTSSSNWLLYEYPNTSSWLYTGTIANSQIMDNVLESIVKLLVSVRSNSNRGCAYGD